MPSEFHKRAIARITPEERAEMVLKLEYFSAEDKLRKFLSDKYSKYHGKPVQINPGIYPKFKTRVGFYKSWNLPSFINDARIHRITFAGKDHFLCDEEFEIYKKKINQPDGKLVHYVDVKCPECKHVGVYDMRFLVWKLNCKSCLGTITVDNRVKNEKFNMSDFR